ncbi:MAG: hypothetical protein AAGE52_23325 [Myxococcota bacterium]
MRALALVGLLLACGSTDVPSEPVSAEANPGPTRARVEGASSEEAAAEEGAVAEETVAEETAAEEERVDRQPSAAPANASYSLRVTPHGTGAHLDVLARNGFPGRASEPVLEARTGDELVTLRDYEHVGLGVLRFSAPDYEALEGATYRLRWGADVFAVVPDTPGAQGALSP